MLARLRLRNFRCFETLDCSLGEGVSLFIGDNAQGKTSILEAVCVLMRLQSPRASGTGELVRFGEGGFAIDGEFGGKSASFPNLVSFRNKLAILSPTFFFK